jgi:hypothetical protein
MSVGWVCPLRATGSSVTAPLVVMVPMQGLLRPSDEGEKGVIAT